MRLRESLVSADPFRSLGVLSPAPKYPRSRFGSVSAESDEKIGPDLWQFLLQQKKVQELEDALAEARQIIANSQYSSPTRIVRNHEAVLQCTSQLFPDATIAFFEEADPESDDDDEYFAVSVTSSGEVDDLAEQHREWHRRVRAVAPETARYYRLLIDVQ